jgi:Tfp pilus assembly protein PilF
MSDPKPLRVSLRMDTLATALQQKLENEAAILDLLVSALARGQSNEAMWEQLHDAALRDDRVAELAFAYDKFSKDKRLRSLNPGAQTVFLLHAGSFFAEVFGDIDGAEPYLDRAFSLSPGDAAVFEKLTAVLSGKGANARLGEVYALAAAQRTDRAEQLRMLHEAAVLLAGDEDRVAKVHLEVLKIDPTDATSRRALEECYERGGKLGELAKLLEQALPGYAAPADLDALRALRVRLISLYAGGIGEVERALPHVEELLKIDPAHPAARAIAVELLGHKGVAARAAAALSGAYELTGEPSEAARMLGIEIDLLRGPKRLDAQKRLAALTFERLADPEKTFLLDEAILPLDPADHEVRARYVKIASALDKQLEATKVLTRAATGAKDPVVRARINADLGDLLVELGDGRKARVAYQAALDARAEDPATLRAARALATICADAKDHRALAAALARLTEIEPAEDARIEATLRLATLSEIELRDAVGAIGAYRKLLGTRLEAEALTALERLLEASGAYVELCEVLDLRVGKERDPARARALAFHAAEIRTMKLPDRAAALEAWKGWIAAYGPSREALERLVPLLETERRWDDLAVALVAEAETSPEADRAAILARLGQVRLGRLGDGSGALDAYRQALAIDPAERTSRLALDKMLAAGELRLAAADVLEPLARSEGAWTVLLRVLEARAGLLADATERLAALREAVLVAHRDLKDAKRAVDLAGRGLELALDAAPGDVAPWIERVEQVAGADATRSAVVLRRVLGDRSIEGAALLLLARRTGEALAASGDVVGALEVLRRALASAPTSHELLDRLDDLLREHGSHEERRALQRAALEHATEPFRRRALRLTIGAIERRDLGDTAAAVATYRGALAEDATDLAAFAELLDLLEARGDWDALHEEITGRLARADGDERVAMAQRLAALRTARVRGLLERAAAEEGPSGDPAAAAALYEQVIALDPEHDAVLAARAKNELQRDTPEGAAELAASRRDGFTRLLDDPALPPALALTIALRAVGEAPFDLELWDRAAQIALEVRGADQVAAAYRRALGVGAIAAPRPVGVEDELIEELGRRAVEYHEEWFDDQETVVALLRRTVELAPFSTWAFERLKLTYNLGERWGELFSLYDEVLARTLDPAARRELLEDAALTAKDLAADTGRAMGYFEALLELRDDARIRTALERLYERHGRHRPLITLLMGQLRGLVGEAAQRLRARIAGLWIDGVGEPASAVAILVEMLDAEPGSVEALDLLERVLNATAKIAGPEAASARLAAASRLKARYRAEGKAEALARVLEIELEGATTPADRAERQRALVRLKLDELGDEAGAFEGLAALLLLEPAVVAHRDELSRLALKLENPERLAAAFADAAEQAEGAARLDLLASAALVYERDLGNIERATALNQVIFAHAPAAGSAALGAARELDRLLEERAVTEKSGEVARVLVLERCNVLEALAKIEPSAAARRAVRVELSRLAWSELGDGERAIRAFRSALAEDPRDAEALDGLAQALTVGQRWAELTEVLEQRAAGLEGDAARQDWARAARIFDEQLGDPARAITAWTQLRARFGDDAESVDALAALLEKTARWGELAALLEHEATSAASPDRGADLWGRVGDLHRAHTGRFGESIAAYDLALSLRAQDEGARRGLEVLVARLGSREREDVPASEAPALIGAATALLGRIYAASDAWEGTIALLEPRLVAAVDDGARAAILVETAALLEVRGEDVAAAFDVIFRALSLTPTQALAVDAIRLADLAGRTDVLAAALAGGFDARADVSPRVARALLWHVAIWQRDQRLDLAAAEAALTRVLALDPDHLDVLEALAVAQRRSPDRRLIETLLRIAEVAGGELDRWAEAVEVAGGPIGDRALATSIAETLLAAATARWTTPQPAGARFESAPAAAAWAIEILVRLARAEDEGEAGAARAVEIYRRSALLPFDAQARRRLRVAAAELAEVTARIAIYEELFGEDPSDPLASERLDALYGGPERAADRAALRARQIAVAVDPGRRVALRFELGQLLAAAGDDAGAIASWRENLVEMPTHAASAACLAELLLAGGHHLDLVALSEDRAARLEAVGDAPTAAAMWASAALRAEEQLADVPRAIAAHRRAAALGEGASAGALARLLIARGDHADAARVLEDLCAHASPEALPALALRLTDAYLAANDPDAARARLEHFAPRAREGEGLRERLAALYREVEAWEPLAGLVVESAARATTVEARAARLGEAAAIHLDRRDDPAAAVALLHEASALAPEDGALRRRLAAALIAAGRLEEAAAALRVLLAGYGTRRPKERGLVHYELARVSLAAGDRPAAVAELDLALRIDPAQPEILHLQARLALEEGQLERAARTYRALLLVVKRPREEPGPGGVSRAELLFELCEIAQLQGDAERSAEYLESAFETARETVPEAERLVAVLRARKRYDLLARALEARLATGPAGAASAAALEELAGLYDERLGRSAEAVDARLRALATAPPTLARLDAARELAARAGATDRFVAVVARLADREGDAARAIELRLQIARALDTERGDLAAAAAAYRAAEALLEAQGPSARLDAIRAALLHIHEGRGDTEALAELLEKQIARDGEGPAAADALYRLAALRFASPSQHVEATALLDRALAADPRIDRAEALLRQALALDPASAPALAALERIGREAGRERTLIEALVLSWERDRKDGDASKIEEAVALAARLDDGALAAALLEKAIARAESAGDAAFGWAMCQLAERRLEEGRLAEAAALKERAARAAEPERERALLLEAAAIAAGPLADLPLAARLLEELRSREPAEREIWQPLVDVYRRLGDRDRLVTLLDETAKILDSAAERAELRLERARMVMVDDEPRAITLLEEIVEDDPTAIAAAQLLTELLEKHGRKEALITVLGRRIDVAKDRQDVPVIVALSLRLGALLEHAWDEGGALDVYHAALDWDGKSVDLLRAIVRIGMAREDSVALGSALDLLLVVEQGEPAAELSLRLARIRAGHDDGEGAELALEQGFAACPGHAELRDELIRRYEASESWAKLAALHVREAEARPTTPEQIESLCRAADILRGRSGDAAAAAVVLRRAFDLDPTDRDVLLALIDAHGALGEHAQAIAAVSATLAVMPEDAWLYRARASLHEAGGDERLALADLEQAHARSGGYAGDLVLLLERALEAPRGASPEARVSERSLRLRLAEVLAMEGQIDRARAELTELTRGDGKDRAALRALAAIEDQHGSWEAASSAYARLIPLESGDALAFAAVKLADACARGGHLSESRLALERAREAVPTNPAVRARLRDVYNMLGAGRELAQLIFEDAAAATDPAVKCGLLLHAGRLLLDAGDAPGPAAAVLEEARSLLAPQPPSAGPRAEEQEILLLLSDAYFLLGRVADAQTLLDVAVAGHKGRRSRQLAGVHRKRAQLELAVGDRAAALGALTRSFESDPQNASLAMELGELAIEREDLELASRAYRGATLMKQAPPGSSEGVPVIARAHAYYQLARIAVAQGDRRKARLMIDKAVADDPTHEGARYLLEQLRAGQA